jgi:hypothetical protein
MTSCYITKVLTHGNLLFKVSKKYKRVMYLVDNGGDDFLLTHDVNRASVMSAQRSSELRDLYWEQTPDSVDDRVDVIFMGDIL